MHSMGVAFRHVADSARNARQERPQDDMIFLSGMLHDIGYLALAHLEPNAATICIHAWLLNLTGSPSR